MSFRSNRRTASRRESSSDTLESIVRRENFNRIRNIFEIRRPSKSPNGTLRKSKSISGLTSISSDDERESNNERVFMRTNSSNNGNRGSKYRKKNGGQKGNDKSKDTIEDIIIKSDIVRAELDLQLKSQRRRKDSTISTSDEDHSQTSKTFYCNEQDHLNTENETTNRSETIRVERKFIKNYIPGSPSQNSLGRRKTSRELISRKQKKENKENISNFIVADSEGETETYRKSLVHEMDLEVAKMKFDGFLDEDENSIDISAENTDEETEDDEEVSKRNRSRTKGIILNLGENSNQYKQLFEELDRNMQIIRSNCELNIVTQLFGKRGEVSHDKNYFFYEEQVGEGEPITKQEEDCEKNGCISEEVIYKKPWNNDGRESACAEKINTLSTEDDKHDHEKNVEATGTENRTTDVSSHAVNFEDDFYESLGDDLENGAYFVEAYNDDGRELIIVEISLERRSVSLDKRFLLKNIENSMKGADMVFHERDDKSLSMIENAKEFVNENGMMTSNGFSNESISNTFSNESVSNRSTVYSTTSRDSDVFDDDDEGISMGNVERKTTMDDNAYNNVRRETFCDHKGIVRIERIGYPETVHSSSLEDVGELQSPVSRNNSFMQKGKLSYIIDEIKSTEKKYVSDLAKVVKKYIPYFERHTPPQLRGKQYYIFGNIQTLWEHQKQFAAALESCGDDAEDIVITFIQFEELFELYPKYFKNKPKADVILREFNPLIRHAQERFNERLDLSSYLLTPLQRLGKYKLFLESIEKQLRKLHLPTDRATLALEIIKREMSRGNDYVAIESIENSPLNKTDYGSFKMREIFSIVRPRRFESMVFLFENVVVFTTLSSHRNVELYNYYDSIKMNDLRIATFEDSTIHLTDFTKGKKILCADRFTYVLEAKSEKIKDTWRKAIEDILWQQLYKVKENTMRMYQLNPNRKHKAPRSRLKSGSSTFYL